MNRILLTSLLTFILTINLNAQGGWNIGYILADSISEQHIGLKILPDFEASPELRERIAKRLEKQNEPPHPILFIRTPDTTYLTINSKQFLVKEIRRIGVDYGYMKDQAIELSDSNGRTFSVYELTVTNFQNGAVELEVNSPELATRFWIGTNLLDGLMHKK